jgi:hypothetical protein
MNRKRSISKTSLEEGLGEGETEKGLEFLDLVLHEIFKNL